MLLTVIFMNLWLGGLRLDLEWTVQLRGIRAGGEVLVSVSDDGFICLGRKHGVFGFLYDPDGQMLRRFGGFGGRPQQLRSLDAIDYVPSLRLFTVRDRLKSQLLLWDLNGDFIRAVHCPKSVRLVRYYDSETLWFVRMDTAANLTVGFYAYDISSGSERKMGANAVLDQRSLPEPLPEMIDPFVRLAFGSSFLALNRGSPQIQLLSLDDFSICGTFVAKAGFDSRISYYSSKKGNTHREWLIGSAIDLLEVDGDDRVWAVSHAREPLDIRRFSLFNADGNLLAAGSLEAKPNAIDRNHFYFVEHRPGAGTLLKKVAYRLDSK